MADLTPQQELFCQKYIECKCNASEAYRRAYNCEKSGDNTIWVNASRLLNETKVTLRIQELQAEAAKRSQFTVDDAIREYNEARLIAAAENQAAPMISATKAKCELFGLDAPKKINLEGSIGEWLSSLQSESEK